MQKVKNFYKNGVRVHTYPKHRMKKLANIVTKEHNTKFGNIYNVVNSCEYIDDKLPTLYIGLNMAKQCIAYFNILEKHYPSQNCWWTFSKTERRNDYINDTTKFQEDVVLNALKEVKYEHVDFMTYTLNRLKKFIRYVMSSNDKICFLTRNSNFLFIYDTKLKCVFGLSLTLCEYCGVDRHKVVDKIKKNKRNKFIYDTSFLTVTAKKIIGDNTHYILPLADYFSE